MVTAEVYALAVEAGIGLGLERGRLVVDATMTCDVLVLEAVWEEHVGLALILAGRPSGHRWAECDRCHEGRLITGASARCLMTPRCRGRHRPGYRWLKAGLVVGAR